MRTDPMKNTRANGTSHAVMGQFDAMNRHNVMSASARGPDLAGAAQLGTVDPVPFRSRQVIEELENLKQALSASQEESKAAHKQIGVLTDTVRQLRQEAQRREQELVQVRHFAYHDDLTGLPNRSLLLDRLNQAIVQATRQNKQVGLLLLDLDGFKGINDRLGHAAGDKLLQQVAERLLACIRSADTACRYGGDEFVILLPDIDGEKSSAEVAQKMRAHLADPYIVDNHAIAVTASIGVAVYPFDGTTQGDLIRRADIAMYLAKARYRDNARAASAIPSFQPAAQN
ncbi:MAG: GGDEF domain-containing protein [Betaproteobacteria bacterium]